MNSRSIRRRESFDEVAELYDRARPTYPPCLVEDLLALSGLEPGNRALEIGPGTGQLTVPLAERGLAITAVEVGANLARVTRQKVERFERAQVIHADFEQWPLPLEPFDLVVAATAFHWLDPEIGLPRCASALRPGGWLAIIDTHWGVRVPGDSFAHASQECYARWDPNHDPEFRPPGPEALPENREDLATATDFTSVLHRRYNCERGYDAVSYCDLLGTFSDIRAMEETSRIGFLGCVSELIETQFGGRIVRHDVHDLWLAQKGTGLPWQAAQ